MLKNRLIYLSKNDNKQILGNESQTHILYLDGLRAVAAISVVMHHSVLQYYGFINLRDLSWYKKLFILIFLEGHYAVDLFIVISGYCLMLPLIKYDYKLKNGVKDFFLQRAKRIIPTYYSAMLISLLLIWTLVGTKTGTHWDISIPVNSKDILTHIFLIHDIFSSTAFKINHAFWSISVEIRIYILFPILLFLWKRAGRVITLLIAVLISILVHLVSTIILANRFNISNDLAGVFPYLILFTFGMLAADIANSNQSITLSKIRKNVPWGGVTSILLIPSLIVHHLYKQGRLSMNMVDIVIGLTCASLMIALAKTRNEGSKSTWLVKILAAKPIAFCGLFAYSIYLIHAPFLQLFSQYFLFNIHQDGFSNMLLLIFICTPIIIFISYIFFLVFEKPFLNKKGKAAVKELEKKSVLAPAP
jgi:peptidoglycan/LPS O-acetylase OafA/YrhL